MRKKKPVQPKGILPIDPTIESTPIAIDGKVYQMCFDLASLAEAEHAMVGAGHDVNLLYALPKVNLESTRILFAASLQRFHSELEFQDRLDLLTLPYVLTAANAIADAWGKALAKPDSKANPPQPGQ